MGRKSTKKVKKQAPAPAEEPKIKRARILAEELNAEELRALLAAKMSGTPLSPAGLEFVAIEQHSSDEESKNPEEEEGAKVEDEDGAGEQEDGSGEQEDGSGEQEDGSVEQKDGSGEQEDGSGEQEDGSGEEEDGSHLDSTHPSKKAFPMPMAIKDESEATAPLEMSVQDNPIADHRDEINALKLEIETKKKRIKDLKRENKDLAQANLRKDQIIIRLNEENFRLKDKKKIPQVKFTTSPDMNITVRELEDFNQRARDSDSQFVSLILVKLIGAENLINMSATGKQCPRLSNVLKEDGTAAFPPKERIDPKVVKFICEKVAQRTAIKEGAANLTLIIEASNEELIRKMIGWKIGNLVKADRTRQARELTKDSPSSSHSPGASANIVNSVMPRKEVRKSDSTNSSGDSSDSD